MTVLLLIAAAVTTANGGSDNDVFSAEKAWLYVTILASAYLVSRGLAKSGSQDPYTHDPTGATGTASASA